MFLQNGWLKSKITTTQNYGHNVICEKKSCIFVFLLSHNAERYRSSVSLTSKLLFCEGKPTSFLRNVVGLLSRESNLLLIATAEVIRLHRNWK